MKLYAGDSVVPISLTSIEGEMFSLDALKGQRFMLSFFRFASCPFCNLRMHELVSRIDEFGDSFTIVAVFDSPLDNLQEHATGHAAPFPILADPENIYYYKYGIEHSLAGVFKGMIFRMPTLLKGMLKGYVPLKIKGSMTTMPADFLVDETGLIRTAYYGSDEGDHLPIEAVKAFATSSD
ncbi:ahpC/TSA family protein [Mariprofundus micogutta]|uniref:AhpC/TSA family protein n=1 Tax=Mariprofundus micogutta TaxID=1921010 RepID=A0A1L8CK86_9PROT|nr:peroxiredoxin-like family protein [Mariprofundus micogutta]GAV19322.1 ahpC/TSA family protein [Mariprofundus micogutta]